MRRLYCCLIALCLVAVSPARAQFTNGQAAIAAWGQTSLNTSTFGTSATTLFIPQSVARDPLTGKVFVSDTQNHRVLRFASVAALVAGTAAEAVLGQPTFTSNTPTTANAPTATGMRNPYGLAVGAASTLYVGDAGNFRVLRFNGAATLPNGAAASGVLGQPNFTTAVNITSATGLSFAHGLFMTSAGRLYVADILNHRVVAYDNAGSKPNGGAADLVLGQPNFTANTAATTAAGMNRPYDVAVSPSGDLYVAEQGNHRVTRFANASALVSGTSATGVLGQPGFATNALATTATGLNEPSGLAFDGSGQLYVADYGNNRVLVFNAATTAAAASGPAALVLGQATFTTGAAATTAAGMQSPKKAVPMLNLTPSYLFVTDSFNNRVLVYSGTLVGTEDAPRANRGLLLEAVGGAVRVTARRAQTVRVDVYTVLGQRLATLFDGAMDAGASQTLALPGSARAGLYLVRATGAAGVQTVRVVR